jgi:hypothetical protein
MIFMISSPKLKFLISGDKPQKHGFALLIEKNHLNHSFSAEAIRPALMPGVD